MRTGRRRTEDSRRERQATSPRAEIRLLCSGRDLLVVEPAGADQAALATLVGLPLHRGVRHAVSAVLWPDSDNPYDSLGVAVWIGDRHAGWLRHADSPRVFTTVSSLAAAGEACECGALIVSSEPTPDGAEQLAVELMFDLGVAEARLRSLRDSDRSTAARSVGRSVAS